jgi:hypothetical protein
LEIFITAHADIPHSFQWLNRIYLTATFNSLLCCQWWAFTPQPPNPPTLPGVLKITILTFRLNNWVYLYYIQVKSDEKLIEFVYFFSINWFALMAYLLGCRYPDSPFLKHKLFLSLQLHKGFSCTILSNSNQYWWTQTLPSHFMRCSENLEGKIMSTLFSFVFILSINECFFILQCPSKQVFLYEHYGTAIIH